MSTYIALALANDTHFHPRCREAWKESHTRALEEARKVRDATPIDGENLFLTAFFVNAFGDHFLQDAFASGHAGFARTLTATNASKVFHDILNKSGRTSRNARGDEWRAFGDGQYRDGWPGSFDALLGATSASVESVLFAAVSGKVDTQLESRVLDLIPTEVKQLEWHCGEIVDETDTFMGLGRDCSPQETDVWEPIDGISQPASITEYTLFGFDTRLYPQLQNWGAHVGFDWWRWLRPGITVGIATSDRLGPGWLFGGNLDFVPWIRAPWDSIWKEEVITRLDVRLNDFHREATPDNPERARDAGALSVAGELAVRVSLQTGVGYQTLWLEPSIGYGKRWQHSISATSSDVESDRDWIVGVTIGWGMAIGVSGGGAR